MSKYTIQDTARVASIGIDIGKDVFHIVAFSQVREVVRLIENDLAVVDYRGTGPCSCVYLECCALKILLKIRFAI